jgi:cell wall-associated NlpC family hydrolase
MNRSLRPRLLATVVAVLCLLPLAFVAPAGADEVGDARAQARQISDDLDRLSDDIGRLNEEYNQAQVRLDETNRRLADTQARVDAAQATLDAARAELAGYAVTSYVSGDTSGDLAEVILHGEGPDATRRLQYLRLASSNRQGLIERVRGAKEATDRELSGLHDDQAVAAALQATLADAKSTAESRLAEQEALLSQVNGELAVLLDQENQRKAVEAYAQATGASTEVALAAVTGQGAPPALPGTPAGGSATPAPAPSGPAPAPPPPGPSPTPTAPPVTTPSPAPTAPPGPTPTAPPTTTPRPTTPPPTTPPTAPPVSSGASRAVSAAVSQLGVPYVWAGASPSQGFDCSGLTSWAWAQAGRYLPHSAAMQYTATRRVAISDLQPGDLTFYDSPVIGHVGMFVGGGTMIEAPRAGLTVRYSSIYRSSLVGAGRP